MVTMLASEHQHGLPDYVQDFMSSNSGYKHHYLVLRANEILPSIPRGSSQQSLNWNLQKPKSTVFNDNSITWTPESLMSTADLKGTIKSIQILANIQGQDIISS